MFEKAHNFSIQCIEMSKIKVQKHSLYWLLFIITKNIDIGDSRPPLIPKKKQNAGNSATAVWQIYFYFRKKYLSSFRE